ncbi:MAG: nuclear transport factor 2 family protein [Acidobacteria bacterium]|nr:nuclear transport factor 2 family protein [Acidobacteriota bacterium]
MKPATLLVAVLAVVSVIAAAQTEADQTEVRSVISEFERALQTRSIEKIERLVSADVVVFENGYRNDGWADFRDRHLIPQFKASPTQYKSEIVKIDVGPSMAWGYSRMSRAIIHDGDKRPDLWAIYILKKEANKWRIVELSWSVRRVGE